jgi:hypothetical protein
MAGTAWSVQRLAAECKVRGSNPSGGKDFRSPVVHTTSYKIGAVSLSWQ